MPHEECVQLIKRAGDTLALKVVTINPSIFISSNCHRHENLIQNSSTNNSSQSLPYRRKSLFFL